MDNKEIAVEFYAAYAPAPLMTPLTSSRRPASATIHRAVKTPDPALCRNRSSSVYPENRRAVC